MNLDNYKYTRYSVLFQLMVLTTLSIVSCSSGNSDAGNEARNKVNKPPSSNAGADQNLPKGTVVILDGGDSSDPEGDPLTYQWEINTLPEGSNATLSDATVIHPQFTGDQFGEYIFTLVVNDGENDSTADEVRVLITNTIVIYENDFSINSLDDFIVGHADIVTIENEQLKIYPGSEIFNSGSYVSLHLPSISELYNPVLSNNLARVVISVNISNRDSEVCGECNNMFYVRLFSHSNPLGSNTFGYVLSGGGHVGDRLMFRQMSESNSIFGHSAIIVSEVVNGLPTLPAIGAFKLVYDPVNNLWELYFEQSVDVIDPETLDSPIDVFSNEAFVDQSLPYLILGSGHTGDSAFFDNLKVTLEYLDN